MSRRIHGLALLSIIFSFMMIFSVAGCAKKAVSTGPSGQEIAAETKTAAQSGAVASTASSAAKTAPEAAATATTEYVVKKGENLWWIAKYKDVYDDSYLWPLIYNANKGQIKNPNRIYPGQKLKIPRDGFSMNDIKMARKKAGAKKPYTPPAGTKPPIK